MCPPETWKKNLNSKSREHDAEKSLEKPWESQAETGTQVTLDLALVYSLL